MKQKAKSLAERWLSGFIDAEAWEVTEVQFLEGVYVAFYARKDRAPVAGNAPLIVDCDSERVISTGTAEPIAVYLSNYRRTGDPHVAPVQRVRLFGATEPLTVISGTRAIRGFTQASLFESKAITEHVLSGEEVSLSPTPWVGCDRLLEEVRDAGFRAELVWEDPRKKAAQPIATDNPGDAH